MKKLISFLLLAAFIIGNFSASAAAENRAAAPDTASEPPYSKSEVVYTVLNNDGSCGELYIVNIFDVKTDTEITDYGRYESVTNLSDDTELKTEGDAVSFYAKKGLFYYQGNMNKAELPWSFTIDYYLDGEKISPDELGGRSGLLRIELRSAKNENLDPLFSDNYVQQISFSVKRSVYSVLNAEGAQTADAGAKKQITYTVLPGSDAECVVEMEVTDFEMDGITIAAVPFSMSFDTSSLGLEDMTEAFTSLTDGAYALYDGASQAAGGAQLLADNGPALTDGSAEIKDGLGQLSEGGTQLVEASAMINDAFSLLKPVLDAIDPSKLEGLGDLSELMPTVDEALKALENALTQTQTAVTAISAAVESVITGLESAETEADTAVKALEAWLKENPSENSEAAFAALDSLKNAVGLITTAKNELIALSPYIEELSGMAESLNTEELLKKTEEVRLAVENIIQSSELASSISRISEMLTGLTQLADGYAQFHEGLIAYTGGVTALSEGYNEFHDGLGQYVGGVGSLAEGLWQLSNGTYLFYTGVSMIPDELTKQIDDMLSQFTGGDFKPMSFTDGRNTEPEAVQFVLSTPAITLPTEEEAEEAPEESGFFDRLLSLFTFSR